MEGQVSFNRSGQKISGNPIYKNKRALVCQDSIRLACGHRYNTWTECYVDAVTVTAVRALLMDHDEVLVDDTHTTAKNIIRMLEIDPDANYHLVNTDPDTCKQRAAATGQSDLNDVIDRMWNNILNLSAYEDIKYLAEGVDLTMKELREKAVASRQFHRIV